jgi:hypothetical protein
MSMKNRSSRTVWLMIVLSPATIPVPAQSGRAWMSGKVFNESDSEGIGSARVELIGDPDSPRMQSKKLTTNTDKEGKYSFRVVPYGDYTFRVSANGFITYEIKLYVASDVSTELHVKLWKKN